METHEMKYEIEVGDTARWFYVTRKEDGKRFRVARIYEPENNQIGYKIDMMRGVDYISPEEHSEIKDAVKEYLGKITDKRVMLCHYKYSDYADNYNNCQKYEIEGCEGCDWFVSKAVLEKFEHFEKHGFKTDDELNKEEKDEQI